MRRPDPVAAIRRARLQIGPLELLRHELEYFVSFLNSINFIRPIPLWRTLPEQPSSSGRVMARLPFPLRSRRGDAAFLYRVHLAKWARDGLPVSACRLSLSLPMRVGQPVSQVRRLEINLLAGHHYHFF